MIKSIYEKLDELEFGCFGICVVTVLILGVLFGLLCFQGWLIMLLWNWLVVSLFNAPVISFWMGVGIKLLLNIIGACFRVSVKND